MAKTQGKSLDILVIDDDAGVVEILGTLLKFVGQDLDVAIAVIGCTTATEGIREYDSRFAAGKPYDGVITDLVLPDLDGEQVILYVKNKSPKTPVYIATGYPSEYERLKAKHKEKGPDGVLIKTHISSDTLRPVVEEILSRKYAPNPPTIPYKT